MSASARRPAEVATLTLNPAIDRTIAVRDLVPGSVNRAEIIGDRPGGKGINVAAALAEQGRAAAALGFLGRENESAFAAFFAAHAIDDRCLRLPGPTRTGLKLIDSVRGETTDLNFPGLSPSPADLEALTRQLDALDTPWAVLAGSLPPAVPVDFYAAAIRRLRARGIRVGLDTSGPALRAALSAAPDFIKPNVHELADLVGRSLPDEAAILDAARELAASGIDLVVVSRGAQGAVFVTADSAIAALPPAISVRSTVGAGDAMVAGIVAASLDCLPLAETARLATAYSAFALTRGSPPRPPRETIAAFAAQVAMRPV